jgi:RHS repeat-associated protein
MNASDVKQCHHSVLKAYHYDLNGNRTIAGYQTTTNNRLQSDGTYTYLYDDEGNLTRRTTIASNETTEYTWDYRNRLTQVLVKNSAGTITRQVNFVYDALNRRIEKRVDPDGSGPNPATIERFIYDRDHIKLVFNGTNTLIRRYLHGPAIDQVLADENVVPRQVSWALSDHQGSVRDWVNNSAVIQNHIRYDSFGRITSQSVPTFNPRFAYTGREWDREIGLYFYRARYYDAIGGRFIGEDAIGFGGGDANLYRYVVNSPTNLVDPMGMQVGAPPAPPPPVMPVPVPPTAPPPGPWYVPLLRKVPLFIPLVIPGGLLNPRPTSNGELPWKVPKNKKKPCPPMAPLDPPWKDRDKWPRRCQLETQSPQPGVNRELCIYRCKDDPLGWFTHAFVPLGGKCPKWINWAPGDRMLDPDNLPPDVIP